MFNASFGNSATFIGDIVFGSRRSNQWMQWMQYAVDAVDTVE